MISNDELLHGLMDKVATQVVGGLRESISAVVEREISKSLSRMLLEGEFYRKLNSDMQTGLRSIYREISSVRQQTDDRAHQANKQETNELISEASDQLDKILHTTEQATVRIMDIVEKHLDLQAEAGALLQSFKDGSLDDAGRNRLMSLNSELNQDLLEIMTTLSFQDLTGQRIKRIITALKLIEQIVLETYVSTGLKLKAREEAPDRDLAEVEAEAEKKVSELKGPQTNVSQASVDNLLAQLGM